LKVAVKDACMLIDLADAGLLDAWFHVGIATFTTDLAVHQVKGDQHWLTISEYLEAGILKVVSLNGDQVTRMRNELGHLPIGVEDQTVLLLALEKQAMLITSDRRLRLEGLRQNLETHDVRWVLDELVAQGLLPASALKLEADYGKPVQITTNGADTIE